MTTANTSLKISQTDNASDAFVAIYTDGEMMAAWCAAPATLRNKLIRARHCLGVACNPRGRFGLDSTPIVVKSAIDAFIAECERAAAPVRGYLLRVRLDGLTWNEAWAQQPAELESLGFGPGDAAVLDAAGFGIDFRLRDRLTTT